MVLISRIRTPKSHLSREKYKKNAEKLKISSTCTAIWYRRSLTLHYQTISLTKKSKIMWIVFAVFFMLFLLSGDKTENVSVENQK